MLACGQILLFWRLRSQMAFKQIPNLPVAIALNGTEQLEAVQAGTSVRVTTQQVANLYTTPANGLQITVLTTTQRNALASPADGTLIYNSTDNKFQGRAAGSWVDLH